MRKGILRKISKKFVVITNVGVALVFLLACLAYYANPVQYWYIAFLGFVFPYLLLLIIGYIVLWVLFKSKWCLLNLALLLIASQNISAVFAFHAFAKAFNPIKKNTAIRVLHWNTMCFGEDIKDRIEGSELREKMLAYIKENDADVLCFQEFYDSDLPEYNNNITYVTTQLHYPNYNYTKDYVRQKQNAEKTGYNNIGYLGTAIFTKLPVLDSGRIAFDSNDQKNKESIAFVDVLKDKDTIRIFSTHLQSIRLGRNDYGKIYEVKEGSEAGLQASKNVFAKVKNAYRYRKQQAELVALQVEASPYPVILTGDFNDVPNSYTYATIKHNMTDVYTATNFGIGRTFSAIAPTLRIDYMLASKQFEVLQAKKENKNLSDHYPIVADLEIKH